MDALAGRHERPITQRHQALPVAGCVDSVHARRGLTLNRPLANGCRRGSPQRLGSAELSLGAELEPDGI